MATTVHTERIVGIPCLVPNRIMQGNGFYVSYNNYDNDLYGGHDTTALVDDDMTRFLILNGDHRQQYHGLMDDYDKCIEYFKANSDLISFRSDKI